MKFSGRHFPKDIILQAVRWYVSYPLSFRMIEEMFVERGITIDHTTINRWVVAYAPKLEALHRKQKPAVTPSWRMDETYTEVAAKSRYKNDLGFTELECERLFHYVKRTQILIHGTVRLLQSLKTAGYGIYALTDNVHEIVAYLQETYDCWPLFDGATVSADLGVMKPQPEIYQALLRQHGIAAAESVFIDDMLYNVEGARRVGMSAIQFENANQCEAALKSRWINTISAID